jgi:RNA polymerase sigma factor (sigma-70 family)
VKEKLNNPATRDKLIAMLPDDKYKQLFRLRYEEHMTYQQIAEAMDYSQRWIERLHRRGLDWLERLGEIA